MDEMLIALTKGIGAELGKKIRITYYEKKRFLLKDDLYNEIKQEKQPLMLDLLALGVFHELAIGPIHGSNNFFSASKKFGVTNINMGSYKIDDQSNKQTLAITKSFFAIMEEYNIGIHQLSIPSVHEFLEKNVEFVRKWQD
ncbi:hypothetical protein [Desulfurivibrio sp. C05AmB]|uniref:hypothetical protein n=1 Tax=Desulfurivibrio sp. C05AmB TaxID=3374371 RepID=UPI00376F1910